MSAASERWWGKRMDLRLSGTSATEISVLLNQIGLDHADIKVTQPDRATGQPIVDLFVELSKIDINLLSLLIGYAIGKGFSIDKLVNGISRPIVNLEDAKKEIIDESKKDAPAIAKNKNIAESNDRTTS
jgi:uncharacterized membrane protein YqgA involved in biofilm formation